MKKLISKHAAVIVLFVLVVGIIDGGIGIGKILESVFIQNPSQIEWDNAIEATESIHIPDESASKTEDEPITLVSVDEIEKDFRTRLSDDPALGAAEMAWVDACIGTHFLGEFYDECNGERASAINLARVRWMKDRDSYNRTLAAFLTYLDTAGKVEAVEVKSGLDDQMYMNPNTTDHVPDDIVMETLNHDGYFLYYTSDANGTKVTVPFRLKPVGLFS